MQPFRKIFNTNYFNIQLLNSISINFSINVIRNRSESYDDSQNQEKGILRKGIGMIDYIYKS